MLAKICDLLLAMDAYENNKVLKKFPNAIHITKLKKSLKKQIIDFFKAHNLTSSAPDNVSYSSLDSQGGSNFPTFNM